MKKLEITEEQVKQILYLANNVTQHSLESKLKEWFPEAFEIKLQEGRWYKSKYENEGFLLFLEEYNEGASGGCGCKSYGFNLQGIWTDSMWRNTSLFKNSMRLATGEEVIEALIKEAEKRGYREGIFFKTLSNYEIKHSIEKLAYYTSKNCTHLHISSPKKEWVSYGGGGCSNPQIFKEGKWAEIVSTMTKEEAEKKLNCKIID